MSISIKRSIRFSIPLHPSSWPVHSKNRYRSIRSSVSCTTWRPYLPRAPSADRECSLLWLARKWRRAREDEDGARCARASSCTGGFVRGVHGVHGTRITEPRPAARQSHEAAAVAATAAPLASVSSSFYSWEGSSEPLCPFDWSIRIAGYSPWLRVTSFSTEQVKPTVVRETVQLTLKRKWRSVVSRGPWWKNKKRLVERPGRVGF